MVPAVSCMLFCLQATLPILIAFSLRQGVGVQGTPSAQLLFLSETVQLLFAVLALPHGDQQVRGTKGQLLEGHRRSSMLLGLAAVCCFIANNVTFNVLETLPLHSFALLSNLSAAGAALLGCWLARKPLGTRMAITTAALLGAICVGLHAATLTAAEGSSSSGVLSQGNGQDLSRAGESSAAAAAAAAAAGTFGADVLLMAMVAVLSAAAGAAISLAPGTAAASSTSANSSSSPGRPPLPQSVRLYALGALLNGIACVWSGRGGSVAAMTGSRWVLVMLLAALGLVKALLLELSGPTFTATVGCCSTLLAAVVGDAMLGTPASLSCYLACALAVCAALQLRQEVEAGAQEASAAAGAAAAAGNHCGTPLISSISMAPQWGRGCVRLPRLHVAVLPVLVACLALTVVVSHRRGMPHQQGPAGGQPDKPLTLDHSTAAAAGSDALPDRAQLLELVNTTDAPMWVLPPFEPTCFPPVEEMHLIGCPVMDCSQHPSCTVDDPGCCSYFNFQMLEFFDAYMTAKCLQDEWLLLYGTTLGAYRDNTILPHTEDVDIGLTPTAVQFLELNSTKADFWRHGYALWYHAQRGTWKVCPHVHHPSPHFQAVMVRDESMAQWETRNGRYVAVYIDSWLTWPVPQHTMTCAEESGVDLDEALKVPWDGQEGGYSQTGSACSFFQGPKGEAPEDGLRAHGEVPEDGPGHKYCAFELHRPLVVQPGSRTGKIGDRSFPMAANIEEQLRATYGPNWRTPDRTYHGESVWTPDEPLLKQALLQKLSQTAWGDMPLGEREQRCAQQLVAQDP